MRALTREILLRVIESVSAFEKKLAVAVFKRLECSQLDEETDLVVFFKEETEEKEPEEDKYIAKRTCEVSDYRFKNLQIRNFRKFPRTENAGLYYGIDFISGQEPANLILLGGNGTGKTSLFSAMEYTMTRFLSSAELRNIPQNNYTRYLPYGNEKFDNVLVILDTVKDTFYSDKEDPELLKYDYLKCFFCSEKDLVEMGKHESLLTFIVSQVGFGEYLKLMKTLNSRYENYQKQANDYPLRLTDLLLKEKQLKEAENEKEKIYTVSKEKINLYWMLSDDRSRKAYRELLLEIKEKKLEFALPTVPERMDSEEASGKLATKKSWVDTYDSIAERFIANYRESAEALYPGSSLKVWFEKEIKIIEALTKSNKISFVDIYEDKLSRYQKYDFEGKEEIKQKSIDELLDFLNEIDSEDPFEAIRKIESKLNKIDERVRILKDEKEKITSEVSKLAPIEPILVPLQEFIRSLQKEYDIQLRVIEKLCKTFVEDILNHFGSNNERYTLSLNAVTLDLTVEFEDLNHKPVRMHPRDYLNSFRFKLFNMSVKVAMALAAMRINKISHPIVFDDVFYSSDFENRSRVEDFILKVYASYDEFVKPYLEGKNLQLIFLTHDDVIIDSIRDGIQSLGYQTNTLYGRLFDYREMKEVGDVKLYKTHKFVNLYISI